MVFCRTRTLLAFFGLEAEGSMHLSFRKIVLFGSALLVATGLLLSCGGGPEPAPGPTPKPDGPPAVKDEGRIKPPSKVDPVPKPEEPVAPEIKEPPLPAEKAGDLRMPDLTGLALTEATDTLRRLGLTLGKVNFKTSKGAKTVKVRGQSPSPFGWTAKGAKVVIEVLGPEAKPVPVPDLKGLSLADAVKALQKAGFLVGRATLRASGAKPKEKGVVVQSPGAATPALPGSLVEITVALGKKELADLKVPDLSGKTLAKALRLLYASGWVPGDVTWKKDEKGAGKVVAQAPAKDRPAKPGDAIALTVGVKETQVSVPDLKGKTDLQASEILAEAGLRLGAVTPVYGKPADLGKIVSQKPASGQKKPLGAIVTASRVAGAANPPTAVLSKSLSVVEGKSFSIDGGRSRAHGGRAIDRYEWKRGESALPPSDKPVLLEKGLEAGKYAYTLVVVDSLGLKSKPAFTEIVVKEALIAVPDLSGKTLEGAKAMIGKAGLVLGKKTDAPGKGKPGEVVGQSPRAGSEVKKGSKVDLTVGAEKKIVKVAVPNVVGKSLKDAKAALSKAGLNTGKETEAPGEGKPGAIVRQAPTPGTRVKKGAKVDLTVGAEKKIVKVAVPNVVGKSLPMAKMELLKVGLLPGKETHPLEKVKPGKVVGQSPKAGVKVEKGSKVDLVVGAEKPAEPEKPKTVAVPNVVGKSLPMAKMELLKAGLVAGENTPVPGKGTPGQVVGQKPKAGMQVRKGSAVDLEIGAEEKPAKIAVPNLRGLTPDEAKAQLKKAGLVLRDTHVTPGKGDPGKVFSQSPDPGKEVGRGTAVAVWVGAEAKPKSVTVPGVKGMKLEEAKARIEQVGLRVGRTSERSFAGKGGQVIEQAPPPGRNVPEGSKVDLVVGVEPESKEAVVPDLKGLSLMDASRKLREIGLAVGTIESKEDASIPAGRVLAQSPKAGEKIERGSKIAVTIAKKGVKATFEVPDVVGKTREEAEKTVREAGFIPGAVSFASAPEGKAVGTVLSQNPVAGTRVARKGTIALTVAREPGTKVKIPGLLGLPRERAEALLKEAGLVTGAVFDEPHEDEKKGTVLKQTPEAGTEVDPGTRVDLVVASEPLDLVKVPVVLRKTVEEARILLEKAGLKLGKVTVGKKYMTELVIKQSPLPNKKVPKGTAIDVTVTKR